MFWKSKLFAVGFCKNVINRRRRERSWMTERKNLYEGPIEAIHQTEVFSFKKMEQCSLQ